MKAIFSICEIDPEEIAEGDQGIATAVQQIVEGAVGHIAKEFWGELELSFSTEGLAIGCVEASCGAENTYAYFDMEQMLRQAIWQIATNYSEMHRDRHVEDTRRHLRAVRDKFSAAVALLDEAIDDPSGFTEPQDTSQTAPSEDERVKYIRQMCGG